jgi:chemotaxis protein CheX
MLQELSVNEEIIGQVMETICTTVLGLPTEQLEDRELAAPAMSVAVHISGGWNGVVLFWPTESFANQAAAILFAMPLENVTPADAQDCMAELGNMLAGNLKSLLPGPSSLSLPTVTCGTNHQIMIRRAALNAEYRFCCAGESMLVQLFEGDAAV